MKKEIPWNRFAIEALVVVGSILLAFAIQAWWEERQEQIKIQQLISLLEAEVEENLTKIEIGTQFRNAVFDVTQEILATTLENREISSTRFDENLADMFWFDRSDLSDAAIRSFTDGGALSTVDDPFLGVLIANVSEKIETVQYTERLGEELTNQRLIPYFIKSGSLLQLQELLDSRGKPGNNEYQSVQYRIRVSDRRDHRYLLDDEEFLGLVQLKGWSQMDALNDFRELRTEIDALRSYLEKK